MEGNYSLGKQNGEFTYYFDNGEIRNVLVYEMGVLQENKIN